MSTPSSPKWFSSNIMYAFLICYMCATYSVHLVLLDFITLISWEKIMKLLIMQFPLAFYFIKKITHSVKVSNGL
jgi:hypothetical protein